ncbi:MAG: thiopurine S-methyltransferase [Pseudomonadota bacterium]
MEHSFWHQRWEENRIGFHLPETNTLLKKHLHCLELKQTDKIFVPLCGKTLDLLYLKQQGYHVLGNELSSLAVNDFFKENNLPFTSQLIQGDKSQADKTDLVSYRSDGIEIINGDFFALKKNSLDGVKAIYDRASMVALPEPTRKKYVHFLLNLLKKNNFVNDKIKLLLVTLEYDQDLKQGPPFSVTEKEVFDCYQNDFSISLIETQETPMKQRGEISKQLSMQEKVYLLQR